MTLESQAIWYLHFEDSVCVGTGYSPDGTLPSDAIECAENECQNAGPWITYDGTTIVIGSPPAEPVVIKYIPAWLIRQRLLSVNLWQQTVAAMTVAQQIEFSTLQEGIDPADPIVLGLLEEIGADPSIILASIS